MKLRRGWGFVDAQPSHWTFYVCAVWSSALELKIAGLNIGFEHRSKPLQNVLCKDGAIAICGSQMFLNRNRLLTVCCHKLAKCIVNLCQVHMPHAHRCQIFGKRKDLVRVVRWDGAKSVQEKRWKFLASSCKVFAKLLCGNQFSVWCFVTALAAYQRLWDLQILNSTDHGSSKPLILRMFYLICFFAQQLWWHRFCAEDWDDDKWNTGYSFRHGQLQNLGSIESNM